MNEQILDDFCRLVQKGDVVWLLGDIFMCKPEQAKSYMRRMQTATHAQISLVYGNHDKLIRENADLKAMFHSTHDIHNLKVPEADGRQMIVLCHFPFAVWQEAHYGSWHCHGHSHGTLKETAGARRIDIGVDATFPKTGHWGPVSYDQIKGWMADKHYEALDYHEDRRKDVC
jgi:calcineurin-like phosphoesterase family protein